MGFDWTEYIYLFTGMGRQRQAGTAGFTGGSVHGHGVAVLRETCNQAKNESYSMIDPVLGFSRRDMGFFDEISC